MTGHLFSKYVPQEGGNKFEQLLNLFLQLLQYTNGDVGEALSWMNQLDEEHRMTDDRYGMGNFISDLEEKGYIKKNPVDGSIAVTPRATQDIRKKALEEIFGK